MKITKSNDGIYRGTIRLEVTIYLIADALYNEYYNYDKDWITKYIKGISRKLILQILKEYVYDYGTTKYLPEDLNIEQYNLLVKELEDIFPEYNIK